MLTETARIDLQALRQNGYQPTDEEIVKLNDIATRIERGKEGTVVNAPRVGYAGNVVLHEPTIGAIEWWYKYGRDSAESDRGRMNVHFFMLANARNVAYLNTLTEHKAIRKAVKAWLSNVEATEGELWRALLYVKNAYDFEEEEEREELGDEELMDRLWMNVIACSGALGVVPEELRTVTQSELVALLVQANLHARIPMKQSVAKDYIAYRKLMRQIEARGKCNG